MSGPAQRLLPHLGNPGERDHRGAEPVAVERLHLADPVDREALHAAEDRHGLGPSGAHDARGTQVLLVEILERPRHHVAVGARWVLRHAADVEREVRRRAMARDEQPREQVREPGREPAVGQDRDARAPRLPVQLERVLGGERHVHHRAARLDRRAHRVEAEPRGERADHEVVLAREPHERRGIGEIGFGPREVRPRGKRRAAQVGNGDARAGDRGREVRGDHAALLAAAQNQELHGRAARANAFTRPASVRRRRTSRRRRGSRAPRRAAESRPASSP